MIGKTLGHYRIVEKLGKGGMGEVYLAEDTELRRRVAIKLIARKLAAEPDALARFRQEAQAVAALNHPHIVTIHSVEQADGVHFMTMELVEGETLSALIRRQKLSLPEVLDLMIPVFDAISVAHRQGITHRDLKPGNIMVTKDGRVKVLDFGLAKLVEEESPHEETWAVTTPLTEEGVVLGTAAYMSPEQAEGKPIDARSDIFSLGVVMYEMATGRRPFLGDTRAALVSSILRDDPPSVTDLQADLPRHFGRIVKLCLVKDPAERFQTASDVRIQLQETRTELVSGYTPGPASAPAPAPSSAPGQPLAPTQASASAPARTRGLRIVLGVAAIALVAAFAYFATKGPSRPEDRLPAASLPASPAAEDSSFVVAITPFWGATEDAMAEGKVMQALVERQVHELLGGEDDVRILGKELTEVLRSHEEAEALGERLGATAVIWGEVLVLREDVDIQPYVTMIGGDPVGPLPPSQLARGDPNRAKSAEGLQVRLDAPDQLGARKATAQDVGGLALLLAGRFYGSRDPDRALALLRRIDPPSAASLVAEATILRERDEWDDAEDRLRAALELDPASARAHRDLGYLFRLRHEYEAALREYELAIELDPDLDQVYGGLASTYRRLNDDAAAAEVLRTAIELDPEDVSGHHFLGHVLADLGEFKESEAAFRRAIELSPEASRNHVCLGHSYLERERYEEAQAEFEKALEINPDAPDAHGEIGVVYRRLGRYDDAIAAHERAIELEIQRDDESVREHHAFGVTYLSAGRYSEAEGELERALELAEQAPRPYWSSTLHLNYLVTLLRSGKQDAAREHAALAAEHEDAEPFDVALLRFYAGEGGEDEVWAAVEDSVPRTMSEKQCNAFYYVGTARLLGLDGAVPAEPDTAAAVEFFEKCLGTEAARLDAYHLAKATLEQLATD